ncbi:MAG: hypothetical protein KatS3mg095_0866 [Candidatus Parcubacteria bacterium]|nr:MAG: hypothetical protein KatS3mg095_0866 [Candidatus Parcubacteria bacterium]
MNSNEKILINKENLIRGNILTFEFEPNEYVYNPSRPFRINNYKYILARVENHISNESRIYPYILENGIWRRLNWQLSDLELEDPAITIIDNQILMTAVRALDKSNPKNWKIKTVFYYGDDIFSFKEIAEGPLYIKDIRLVKIDRKRIGILSRPIYYKDGKKIKRVSYLEIESLDDLKKINLNEGTIIQLPILEDEWVGTNDICLLNNGLLGVLGHIGSKDKKGNLHYYAISFILNPDNLTVSNFKIIATRDNFPAGLSKGRKYKDVIFPGGIEFIETNPSKVNLYCGLSDANIGMINIDNPYL